MIHPKCANLYALMGCTPQKAKMEHKKSMLKCLFMLMFLFRALVHPSAGIVSADQPYSARLGTCNR